MDSNVNGSTVGSNGDWEGGVGVCGGSTIRVIGSIGWWMVVMLEVNVTWAKHKKVNKGLNPKNI